MSLYVPLRQRPHDDEAPGQFGQDDNDGERHPGPERLNQKDAEHQQRNHVDHGGGLWFHLSNYQQHSALSSLIGRPFRIVNERLRDHNDPARGCGLAGGLACPMPRFAFRCRASKVLTPIRFRHPTHKSNAAAPDYHCRRIDPPAVQESRTSRPTGDGDNPMKNLFLAAFAALSLIVAIAPVARAATFHNGSTVAGDASATRMQQSGGYSQ
jgi:hypothetical protein